MKEQRAREESEVQALEMVRTLWGLDEVCFTLCNNDLHSETSNSFVFVFLIFLSFHHLNIFLECHD